VNKSGNGKSCQGPQGLYSHSRKKKNNEGGSGLLRINIRSRPLYYIPENTETFVLEKGDKPVNLKLDLNDSEQRINNVTPSS
jgi:hypothetical protein